MSYFSTRSNFGEETSDADWEEAVRKAGGYTTVDAQTGETTIHVTEPLVVTSTYKPSAAKKTATAAVPDAVPPGTATAAVSGIGLTTLMLLGTGLYLLLRR